MEWLSVGVERGWCTAPVCGMHDGLPFTPDEEAEWEDGADPCVPMVRLLEV